MMIPTVRLVVLGCKFDVSDFCAVGVDFAPAAFFGALVMCVPFHADFADVTKLLIL